MSNRFMVTAAAVALIAGTSFAYAQGTGAKEKEGPAGGAGMQHSTQSPSTGAEHGMKSSQGGEKMRQQGAQTMEKSGAKGEGMKSEKSAQENLKGEKSKSTQNENLKGEKSKSTQSEEKSKSSQYGKGTTGTNMNAQERENRTGNAKAEGREESNGMKAEGRENRMNAQGRENLNTQGQGRNAAEGRSQTTTGQAGAGARLTTDQRSRITTVIRGEHVAPANNVNFPVRIGTRVPREIGFHPLPQDVVTIYPEWRGFEFFLVRDEIVVVDPRTLEIVAVLPA